MKEIFIYRSVLNIIEKFKMSSKSDREAGGILLGQVTDDAIYILRATTPNKFDKRKKRSFTCDKDATQIIIDYEFVNSNQKTIYFGEWHTHPEKYPSPSEMDKCMIADQFLNNKLNEQFLILFIQGINGYYVTVYNGKNFYQTEISIIEA